MLTRKQRWRRVRGGRFVEPCSSASASDSSHPAGRQRRPHPINSLSIGDSLLHLLGSSTAGEETSEAARESESAAAAAAAEATPSAKKAPSGRVHFNHQVRVVLVPCRTELGGLKADIWWGEDDYLDFRREYILAVRAKMAGMGDDEEDAPSSCADDTTPATTTATETPDSEAEAKAGVPEAGGRGEAAGPEAVPRGEEHDDDDVCGAPLRRKRCHESESAPPTSNVGPSRARSPPVEIRRTLLSSAPLPPATEAPKTPIFSCAFSTPDGAGGMPARESEGESSSTEDVPEVGRNGGVTVGGGGGSGTTVVVTAISRDALAAAAAVVGAAPTVAVSSPDGDGDVKSSVDGCGSEGVSECHIRPAGTVADAADTLAAAVVEGEGVVSTAEASLRGKGIVEKVDGAEVAPQPTQPPSRRSSSSSSSSCSCSCSGCSDSTSASYSGSRSFSTVRAAEKFLEGAAEISTEEFTEQCAADGINKNAARDEEEEEEEEGYRTQSTSSVSDHTDAESDFDTDEGECEDRPMQEEGGVRKNGERPPRTPFRRELPVRN